MSRKRRQAYSGCSLDSRRGRLRLRFRASAADGIARQVARATGYRDTPENRTRLRPLAKLIGAAIEAGKVLAEIDAIIGRPQCVRPQEPVPPPQAGPSGPTVASYYEQWIAEQRPVIRKAQARDYTRHFGRYLLPAFGKITLSELKPADVRGLQAELLSKKLSPKYVKNILSGSFRAMILQAKGDELVVRDLFARLKWPAWDPPDPDPLTPEERTRIIEWFRNKRFGFHPGRGSLASRCLPHPAFHAFVFTLFWTGLRPSEGAGLCWGDIDLAGRRLSVRRSRHMYEYGATKTRQARRQVELFPEVAGILSQLQPLHVAPGDPVFTNTLGKPLEPKVFSRHWYDCLRALGIRQRGLYCTKDTFVTTALAVGVKIPWLEAQTGVSYDTLRRHYGKWVPLQIESELGRFAEHAPGLFRAAGGKLLPAFSTAG